MSTSGLRAAIVSKHSSRMEVRELRELRGLEAMEEEERGRPLGSLSSDAPPRREDQRRLGRVSLTIGRSTNSYKNMSSSRKG